MAYNTNHLRKVADMSGIIGGAIFAYDTVDNVATIAGAGYFADAVEKGVQKGDLILVRIWTTALPDSNAKLLTDDDVATILADMLLIPVIGIDGGAAVLADGRSLLEEPDEGGGGG